MKIHFLRFVTTKKPTIIPGIPMVLFLLFLMLLANISTAQNDLLSMDLIDSVESVREIEYSASDGSGMARGQIISSDRFISFDPAGNMIETLVYKKGRLFSTLKYEYDENGRNTGYKEFDAENRLYLVVEYEYADDGKLLRERYDRSYQKAFDDRRKEIDVEYDTYYKNLYTTIEYEYNILGLVTRKRYLKPDGSPDFVYEFGYSIKRYVNRRTYINGIGEVSWYEKISNDVLGRPVDVKKFERSRLYSTTTIEYENDGRNNWITRREITEIPANIFGDPPQTSSEIAIRDIEYY